MRNTFDKDLLYSVLQKIPHDKVTTYGDLAKMLGNKSFSRTVGNALHKNPDKDKYPCYKVVNSKGYLSRAFAFGGIEAQKRLLEADGIEVIDYAVNLEKYRWNGEEMRMAQIIKTFKEEIPNMRFIGKKYPNFGPMWGQWFANGWFDAIESAMGGADKIAAIWENGGGYVGLERRADGQPFEYWIGMFAPSDTNVPQGFDYIDFADVSLGTCWIYGKEKEVHNTKACKGAVLDAGFKLWQDENDGIWSFENCTCPRYTTPDEQGNIIMDYCFVIK